MGKTFEKDDVIVPKESDFPDGALVVHEVKDNIFTASPLGGGMVFEIPKSDSDQFELVTEEEKAPLFERGKYVLEDVDGEFSGWDCGFHWNGWEMPMFEHEQAIQVLNALGYRWSENQEKNSFTIFPDGEEPLEYFAQEIETADGAEITVYPIGSGEWIWEKA